MWGLHGTICITFLVSVVKAAELPPDALAVLNSFPEKAVTLELVVGRAIHASDSYRLVQSGKSAIFASQLAARAPLETELTFSGFYFDDQREAQSQVQPDKTVTSNFSLGVSTYFETGTSFSATVEHGKVEATFQTFPDLSFFESKASLLVSQNLLKDSFGALTRKAILSGKFKSQAAESQLNALTEDWFMEIVQLFYGAWLAQAEAFAAAENLKSRERLERITQLRMARGTAEKPDQLSLQSATLAAKVQKFQAEQVLGDRWRALVTNLKLPEAWLRIDPLLIPIKLDLPHTMALAKCGPREKLLNAPSENATVVAHRKLAKASQLDLERAKGNLLPTLQLNAGLLANGMEASRGDSFSEAFELSNPRWQVGFLFKLPLSRNLERAERRRAISEQIKNETEATLAVNQLKLDWLNGCALLHQLVQSNELLNKAQTNQTERSRLEEQRFRVGKVGTFAVIQAGDDALEAKRAVFQSASQLRLAAWQVLKLVGESRGYMETAAEKHQRLGGK